MQREQVAGEGKLGEVEVYALERRVGKGGTISNILGLQYKAINGGCRSGGGDCLE